MIVDRILFYGFGILSVVESQRAVCERIVFCAMLILIYVRVSSLTMKMYGLSLGQWPPWPGERVRLNLEQFMLGHGDLHFNSAAESGIGRKILRQT